MLALAASWLAWRALSAFWLAVDPICSIEAEVSSSAEACCSVRLERSELPWAICALAVATLSAPWRTSVTTRVSEVCMSFIAASRGVNSSRASSFTDVVRSPSRTRSATAWVRATRRRNSEATYAENTISTTSRTAARMAIRLAVVSAPCWIFWMSLPSPWVWISTPPLKALSNWLRAGIVTSTR
ncbi:hypothetical protein Y695_02968 [Hydrogenophaga sp. T4]|nr:hypothetical protein Y695_02968 [Hydrogenophaga sp. T4]